MSIIIIIKTNIIDYLNLICNKKRNLFVIDCSLNVHRHCVKVVEELCPGPVVKSKERGNDRISKLMDRMYQRKSTPSHQTHQSHFNRHNLHESRLSHLITKL